MRVAVRHTDPEHPNAQWFAYNLGRVETFVHPLMTLSQGEVVEQLLERAKTTHPESDGYEHQVQTLTAEGEWIPVERAAEYELAPPGEQTEVAVEMTVEGEAGI